jgi:hypothetical protein
VRALEKGVPSFKMGLQLPKEHLLQDY